MNGSFFGFYPHVKEDKCNHITHFYLFKRKMGKYEE